MQSIEFPPTQLYILLAISTTLLGIAVSYLLSSKQSIKKIDIVISIAPFSLTWIPVTLMVTGMAFREGGEWLWDYVILLFHGSGLLFFIFFLLRLIRMVVVQAKEDALS